MSNEHKTAIQAVVIGASAGGINALLQILKPLPANYRLPIMIVLHLPHNRDSKLAEVFRHHVSMTVRQAQDKEWIKPGVIYIAGSGYHLSVEKNFSFSLSTEDPESYARPSIDILMQSAADAYGNALAGVILTGANHDGAAGLANIKAAGGLCIVQDPDDAEVPIMPRAAIALCNPDFVLTLDQIHPLLRNLELRNLE
jgi:two-component system, chemotaxis family, protein-glutamate methylesterase/glutaminase